MPHPGTASAVLLRTKSTDREGNDFARIDAAKRIDGATAPGRVRGRRLRVTLLKATTPAADRGSSHRIAMVQSYRRHRHAWSPNERSRDPVP